MTSKPIASNTASAHFLAGNLVPFPSSPRALAASSAPAYVGSLRSLDHASLRNATAVPAPARILALTGAPAARTSMYVVAPVRAVVAYMSV